jgi:hypothetical protein
MEEGGDQSPNKTPVPGAWSAGPAVLEEVVKINLLSPYTDAH